MTNSGATEAVQPVDRRNKELRDRLTSAAFNRNVAELDHRDAIEDHHDARGSLLDELKRDAADLPTDEALRLLRRAGLLWSSVASMLGVSETAVRKWRKGGPIDAENRSQLDTLIAFSNWYSDHMLLRGNETFGEWLTKPIVSGFSANPAVLLGLRDLTRPEDLNVMIDWLEHADDLSKGERLLDEILGRSWRETAERERRFKIVTDASGERTLIVE